MTGARWPVLPRVPVRYALVGWFYQEPWAYPVWAWALPWWWWRIYLVLGDRLLFVAWWRLAPFMWRAMDALDLDPVTKAWREAQAAEPGEWRDGVPDTRVP